MNHLEGYLRKYGLQSFNRDDSHRVKTFGISGGCVYNASHLQLQEAKIDEFRPHQAILQLGGNDLDQENLTTADADEIVMRLVSLVSLWTNRYNIRDFVILQFMFRRKTRNIDFLCKYTTMLCCMQIRNLKKNSRHIQIYDIGTLRVLKIHQNQFISTGYTSMTMDWQNITRMFVEQSSQDSEFQPIRDSVQFSFQ